MSDLSPPYPAPVANTLAPDWESPPDAFHNVPPVTTATRLERALLSLEGLSLGDAFGETFFTTDPLGLVRARRLRDRPWPWTDDTAMAISVLETLVVFGFVNQNDLARRFAERHAREPDRGYGDGAPHPRPHRGGPLLAHGVPRAVLGPRLVRQRRRDASARRRRVVRQPSRRRRAAGRAFGRGHARAPGRDRRGGRRRGGGGAGVPRRKLPDRRRVPRGGGGPTRPTATSRTGCGAR